jgi:hypothetical protein
MKNNVEKVLERDNKLSDLDTRNQDIYLLERYLVSSSSHELFMTEKRKTLLIYQMHFVLYLLIVNIPLEIIYVFYMYPTLHYKPL